jgi:hypothetical protein
MAKRRRNGKKPNLPKDVLARARKQAGVEEDVKETSSTGGKSDAAETSSVSEKVARRRKMSTVQLERNRQRGELTNEMVEDVLANPTKFVSSEELQDEYKHVLVDLRNMGILAAVLIATLIAFNFVF